MVEDLLVIALAGLPWLLFVGAPLYLDQTIHACIASRWATGAPAMAQAV